MSLITTNVLLPSTTRFADTYDVLFLCLNSVYVGARIMAPGVCPFHLSLLSLKFHFIVHRALLNRSISREEQLWILTTSSIRKEVRTMTAISIQASYYTIHFYFKAFIFVCFKYWGFFRGIIEPGTSLFSSLFDP